MQVFCNGEEVMTVSGTKEKYVVDVWSGNHPFFQVFKLSFCHLSIWHYIPLGADGYKLTDSCYGCVSAS